MNAKSKRITCVLLLIVSVMSGYFIWLSLHPVEVISVHQRNNYSDVLVRNFPFTNNGKVNWWLENKGMLKDKYNIPKPAEDGFYTIIFWDFMDGYKEEEKYDRLCFYDMDASKNCIDKNAVFSVSNNRDNTVSFKVYDGNYLLKENGEIVEIENN
ncbi:DUF943 family protein [Serratia sp. UGAL515B_01]|uniref:DUF943 family protein n=1 Tax=Serratia sp. UGAL515B_01 TaxID=2986763 RepID=UPI0029552196|nr:DUF943 family protein [Serratia sp. UGAL515B_01]WON78986.1 DUF943 family protein [Serratia sp. UGAL515B_01]